MELLIGKYKNVCDKNKSLEFKLNQLTAALENNNNDKDNKTGKFCITIEIAKYKKELSERDKQINHQNSIIDKLSKQLNEAKKEDIEINEIKQRGESHFNNIESRTNIDSHYSLKQLYEENEYLKHKHHKYQMKYMKFKSKYDECQKFLDMLVAKNNYISNPNAFELPKERKGSKSKAFIEFSEYRDLVYKNKAEDAKNEDKILELDKKKSNLSHFSQMFDERNKNDIFVNADPDFLNIQDDFESHNNIDINKINETNEKSKKKQKKEAKKVSKTKAKTQSIASEDESDAKETTKKTIKSKKEKKAKTNNKKKTKKMAKEDNSEDKTSEVYIDTRDPLSHIYPLPRIRSTYDMEKDIAKKKEMIDTFINHINGINFTEEHVMDFLNNFEKEKPLYEKVYLFLDLIFDKAEILDLAKLLYFLDIFIKASSNDKFFTYFKEYILSNIVLLLNMKDNLIIGDNNIETLLNLFPYRNISLATGDLIENKYLIMSFIMALFYPMNMAKEVFELILELFYRHNDDIKKILALFKRLTIGYPKTFAWQINPEILDLYETNSNKLYFFNTFKTKILTVNMANILYDLLIAESDNNNIIINHFNNIIVNIQDNITLDENNIDTVDLSKDIQFLEVIQMIDISFEIKTLDWIYDELFTERLWIYFANSRENSLKRVAIIFYISYILSKFVVKDSNFQNEKTKFLTNWIVSIFDPNDNIENRITVYEKLAALSGFIECCKIDVQMIMNVQRVIALITETYSESIIPKDLLENFIRLGLYIK
jgi:hypothetical protein